MLSETTAPETWPDAPEVPLAAEADVACQSVSLARVRTSLPPEESSASSATGLRERRRETACDARRCQGLTFALTRLLTFGIAIVFLLKPLRALACLFRVILLVAFETSRISVSPLLLVDPLLLCESFFSVLEGSVRSALQSAAVVRFARCSGRLFPLGVSQHFVKGALFRTICIGPYAAAPIEALDPQRVGRRPGLYVS